MASRSERRLARVRLGDALLTLGAVVLVATPVAYKLHARSMHVVETRTWWWPTAWMVVPLLACVTGAFLVVAPNAFRRPARHRAPRS